MDNDQKKATIIGNSRTGGPKMWVFEEEWEAMKEVGEKLKNPRPKSTPKKKKRK